MPSFPSSAVWKDFQFANSLVERREVSLSVEAALTRNSYSTETYIKRSRRRRCGRAESTVRRHSHCHLVEVPTDELTTLVKDMYQLQTVDKPMIVSNAFGQQVQSAIDLLGHCESTLSIVSAVVWSIVIVNSDSPDSDVSYSDPEVPFTIFVSAPRKESEASSLRLAESILHESMHLYLTLIEQEKPLVKSSSDSLMAYSPWRDCLRPLNGVLHGTFVFRAIYDFFSQLHTVRLSTAEKEHVCARLTQITTDFSNLQLCWINDGLTEFGTDLFDELVNTCNTRSW